MAYCVFKFQVNYNGEISGLKGRGRYVFNTVEVPPDYLDRIRTQVQISMKEYRAHAEELVKIIRPGFVLASVVTITDILPSHTFLPGDEKFAFDFVEPTISS